MLISIHDVPREELHLLFCTSVTNSAAARRRQRRQSVVRAVKHALSLIGPPIGEARRHVSDPAAPVAI